MLFYKEFPLLIKGNCSNISVNIKCRYMYIIFGNYNLLTVSTS